MAFSLSRTLFVGRRASNAWIGLAIAVTLFCGTAWAWNQVAAVVKVYPCPAGTIAATADRLRTEFGTISGVRITADAGTSQLVVRAPKETHEVIGRRLAGLNSPANRPVRLTNVPASAGPGTTAMWVPAQAQAAIGAAAAKPPVSRSVVLRSTTEQFEAALKAALGNRLTAVQGRDPQTRRYRLALPGGASIDLTVPEAGKQVTIEGASSAVEAAVRLIQVLDNPTDNQGRAARAASAGNVPAAAIDRAAAAMNAAAAPSAGSPPAAAPAAAKDRVGFVGPVQIEMLDGLDVIVLHGERRDVDQAAEIIRQLELFSAVAVPAVEVYQLRYVDCLALGALVRGVYDDVYLPRQGGVSVTPLIKPNALLFVGRRENVQTVLGLAARLDQPVAPDAQVRVFPLRHAAPAAVQAAIQEMFADRGGLTSSVRTTIDARASIIFVLACPRDMAEVTEMIHRLDTPTGGAVNELRVIRLEHSIATELAAVMQSAIGTAASGGGFQGSNPSASSGFQPPTSTPAPGAATMPSPTRPGADQRSVMLRFLTGDAQGRRLVSSGILSEVRITADPRANSLLVSAPAECIEFIEALVHHLDRLPSAEAQIKVFSIVNGDATNLADMLRNLFGAAIVSSQAIGQMPAASAENPVVGLRFAVDSRTNSIIASGATGDLTVVEAILSRLDDSDVRHRQSEVFRLKNSPAQDVAQAINTFLKTERQVQQTAPGLTSPFEQLEREVVVVPEPVSNSLILSATPRFFEEIRGLIDKLDARPPMVMIQVLIAQVTLGDTNEFGVELGLQDSVLFDRSLLGADGSLIPGYNFLGQPLGNSGSSRSQSTASSVGGQGTSSFSVGRANSTLGFGGLVLSAASENVNVLLRALSECHRVDVLQRPQVMTLDNQPAFIQVGQRVPQITGTQVNQAGQSNAITLINVGLILSVTPRISPDGLVVMEINAENSQLGPEAEGIPVAFSGGQVIRSPRIDTTTAQTTVSATSDQTVILGGLIAKTTNQIHRKVPWLGDVPVLGNMFRFDSVSNSRQELLIIMTPHIVKSDADAEAIKRAEAARMNWCLGDVISLYGDAGFRRRSDEWSDSEVPTTYPDRAPQPSPTGRSAAAPAADADRPEIIPVPAAAPTPAPTPAPARLPAAEPSRAVPRSGSEGWLRRPQSEQ